MACPKCGFTHNCVCHALPTLSSSLTFMLLTHEREITRETNTGKWVASMLGKQCSQPQWSRKMASLIPNHEHWGVLFPSQESISLTDETSANPPQRFIVLDATWQEAQKMFRQTPWLQALPQYHLPIAQNSRYSLRRNQQSGALCTLEIVAEVFSWQGETKQAEKMHAFLTTLLPTYQADKSGHHL